MAYSNDIVCRARLTLANAKEEHEAAVRRRTQEIYSRLPRVREIDELLRRSMALAARAVFTGGGDAKKAMEQVKQANLSLQQERRALIAAHFPAEYLNDGPICPHCGGTGYVGSRMCDCLKAYCMREQVKELSLLASGDQSFDTFRLDYYPINPDPKSGLVPRTVMEKIFTLCKRYAAEFAPGAGNLLFNGGTGLGKTFLSACIARQVAEKGCCVAYETASHLMSKLERNRFSPDEETARQVQKLNDCDLLIIDDLGTEMPGNFVTAALYTLLNDRLLAGKSMVISTNLNMDEVRQRYSPQIASRLEGSFRLLPFMGMDIRLLKNRGY